MLEYLQEAELAEKQDAALHAAAGHASDVMRRGAAQQQEADEWHAAQLEGSERRLQEFEVAEAAALRRIEGDMAAQAAELAESREAALRRMEDAQAVLRRRQAEQLAAAQQEALREQRDEYSLASADVMREVTERHTEQLRRQELAHMEAMATQQEAHAAELRERQEAAERTHSDALHRQREAQSRALEQQLEAHDAELQVAEAASRRHSATHVEMLSQQLAQQIEVRTSSLWRSDGARTAGVRCVCTRPRR